MSETVTGEQLERASYDPQNTMDECPCCGCSFDTEQAMFDALCNECGNDLDAYVSTLEESFGVDIEWKKRDD